ncbi:MAG TPA: hypothetical protein VN736_04395 [Candidatus Limnocylindrales bacterium]|nr:hypothetical protein [Candidatus Limnocylindrales bacterium]
MLKKRFAILRRDLSAYPVTELRGIAHFVQTLDGLFDQANITSGMEILEDLEGAVGNELAEIGGILHLVQRRVASELATRK